MASVIELVSAPMTQWGENPSASLTYRVTGLTSEPLVRSLIISYSPLTYDGLLRAGGSIKPVGYDKWECVVDYRLGTRVGSDNPTTPDANASYNPSDTDIFTADATVDISSQTLKITQSLETRASAKRPADLRPLPDFKRAINVTPDGVEGVDIDTTKMTFSEVWTFQRNLIRWEYIKRLMELRGKVNSVAWRTFEAGEVRFVSAQIAQQDSQIVKITYTFEVSKNQIGIVAFDGCDPVNKKGHEYLWVAYEKAVVAGRGLVNVPYAVFVERVYESANLRDLGIGR